MDGTTIAQKIAGNSINMNVVSCNKLDAITADISTANINTLDVVAINNEPVSWLSTTIPVLTFSDRHSWVYRQNGTDYTFSGFGIGSYSTKTIYYLGHQEV